MRILSDNPLFKVSHDLLNHNDIKNKFPKSLKIDIHIHERVEPFSNPATKMGSLPWNRQIQYFNQAPEQSQLHEIFHVIDWALMRRFNRFDFNLGRKILQSRYFDKHANDLNSERYFYSYKVEPELSGAELAKDNFLIDLNLKPENPNYTYGAQAHERFARYFIVWVAHNLNILTMALTDEYAILASRQCSIQQKCCYCNIVEAYFAESRNI